MGSPTVENSIPPLSKAGDASETLKEDKARTRQRSKRCKSDMRGTCEYGDRCTFSHAPKLSVQLPPMYPPYAHYYPYHPSYALSDGTLYSPPMYYPVIRRDLPNDTYQLESQVRRMNLDGSRGLPKVETVRPRQPPSPPASTATEVSSPTSTYGGESIHSFDDAQPHPHSFYRTKPCKFFHEMGRCVKGDRCNFIHEHSQARRDSVSEDAPRSAEPPVPSTGRRRRVPKKSRHRLDDAHQESNYYPITWRVIGGGVKMSGQRAVCQDSLRGLCNRGKECKYSHPYDNDDDELSDTSSSSYYEYYSPRAYPSTYVYYQPPRRAPPIVIQPAPSELPTIIEPRSARTPTVLDGGKLLPRDEPNTEQSAPATSSADSGLRLPPREIERPWSTPPGTAAIISPSEAKSIQLFLAEMP